VLRNYNETESFIGRTSTDNTQFRDGETLALKRHCCSRNKLFALNAWPSPARVCWGRPPQLSTEHWLREHRSTPTWFTKTHLRARRPHWFSSKSNTASVEQVAGAFTLTSRCNDGHGARTSHEHAGHVTDTSSSRPRLFSR